LRTKIFWKFFFAYLFVIALFLLISYFFLRSYLKNEMAVETAHHLDQILIQTRDSLEAGGQPRVGIGSAEWDPLIDRLSRDLEVRISLIDLHGKVLADSGLSGSELTNLENHRDRPEFIQALDKGYGQSLRYSSTVKAPMMYVARPSSGGVIRTAMPLSGLSRSYQRLNRLLWAGLLLGAGIAMAFSFFLARYFSKPLKELSQAAFQMAEGNLNIKVSTGRNDEIGLLTRRFNLLSENLNQLIQKISDEKNQLQVILESMVEGVMVFDSYGKLLLTNEALREIFEISPSYEGHTPLDLIRNAGLHEVVREALNGRGSAEREIQILRGGALKYVMVHASPLKSQERFQGSVLVFHDITPLRRLENIRKEFVANASHELKTPLAAIKGYTETLLAGALHDEKNAMNFLKVVDQHADRLNQIIQDLLDLSKIESAQYELRLEKISLAGLVEELRLTFQKELESKKMTLDILPAAVAEVWADPSALRQILSNLVDNAVKYSGSGGKIALRVVPSGPSIQFCVEDQGPGISPEHLPRVFERFYRVDSSRSRGLGGTGLGLSIVKHLVQLHGGEAWAESELGRGSRFYFMIPQKGMI